MKVLAAGCSGLIGSALVASLEEDGHVVTRLVRRPPTTSAEVFWDPAKGQLDVAAVSGFDAVVNLAGAGIGDKRWSEARRRVIRESRVQSTTLLAEALAAADDKPQTFISGSAIGYYGNKPEPVTEDEGPADPPDFLSKVVVEWEASTAAAEAAGVRTAHTRTGLVLSGTGGALAKMLLPFRFGVGGKLGSGDTYWSWITLADEVRAIRHLITTPVSGPVNLTSPNPISNAEFTKTLGLVLKRPTVVPVPRFALKLLLGTELAEALLFTSARVLPTKLIESGFEFLYPDLESALRTVLER
jgi:uncharacterized protein (TIGR01777 family)